MTRPNNANRETGRARISITVTPNGRTIIRRDGVDITATLSAVRIDLAAGRIPNVVLFPLPPTELDVELADAAVTTVPHPDLGQRQREDRDEKLLEELEEEEA